VDRNVILSEVRRWAEENGGAAPGKAAFQAATGIRESDWNRHWLRWSEVLVEAGLAPNTLQKPYDTSDLLRHLAELTRELGRVPVKVELVHRARRGGGFPSHNTFERLGRKRDRIRALADFCSDQPDLADVLEICERAAADLPEEAEPAEAPPPPSGYVYLAKSGRFYKIGRTNNTGRREYELALQLPERLHLVHRIATDDPVGIERYWHERFADRRANGEWFRLTSADVAAFKRRQRFM
jgi:hypothetical protein